jgi:hypothetical protein
MVYVICRCHADSIEHLDVLLLQNGVYHILEIGKFAYGVYLMTHVHEIAMLPASEDASLSMYQPRSRAWSIRKQRL